MTHFEKYDMLSNKRKDLLWTIREDSDSQLNEQYKKEVKKIERQLINIYPELAFVF